MKKTLKRVLIAIMVASVALGMASCGGGSPTATAKAYVAAVVKGDTKAIEKVATKYTVTLIGTFGEMAAKQYKEYGKITKTAKEIDGDEATVSLTYENGETEKVTLIKDKDKWLVTTVNLSLGEWQGDKDKETTFGTLGFFKDGTIILGDVVKGEWRAEKDKLALKVFGETETCDYKISG